MDTEKPRWRATAIYRVRDVVGGVDVTHDLVELEDLHDLIEAGPHWDTIESITIHRINHIDSPSLTVEQADQL